MPTAKPRIQVTMTAQLYGTLKRLAELQGESMSAVALELLESVHPVLERIVVVGEAARQAQAQAKEGLRRSAERAEAELAPLVEKALGQFDWVLSEAQKATAPIPEADPVPLPGVIRDRLSRRLQGASGGLSTPGPVIRGSGGGGRKPKRGAPGLINPRGGKDLPSAIARKVRSGPVKAPGRGVRR